MSIESAKAFIERMKTDSEFAGKVAACADAEARMALVKAAGFDFTAQEMDAMKRELTDRELEWVTGGVFHQRLKNEEWQRCVDPFAK